MISAGLCGIVLAAGAGTRYGGPKALARTADGRPWLRLAVTTLERAGCGQVLVAVGAAADAAEQLVPPRASAVWVREWRTGLAASLRDALDAAAHTAARAALVIPVDTPAMPVTVCRRVLDIVPPEPRSLARAVYAGEPGHPVLLGRDHWDPISREASGDRGAGGYLRSHGSARIECSDLWDGTDIDEVT
ncbi:nucleotidyltransferase family protein [Microbacterium karelineae]|uniref:nucleotidyltransferase family protein n=1 Tax=Microbacterium karelineae TaxID=2654283 RepID=UPI0012EA0526|nr:NTP transferase domain-containing protein [Microbacterium karelineae]